MFRSALMTAILVLSGGCSSDSTYTAPGAYIDIRNTPSVQLTVLSMDGTKTELPGSLGEGSWRSGPIWRAIWRWIGSGTTMNSGQLFVETKLCGRLYFIVGESDAYCIGCRDQNFRAENAKPECPLNKPEIREKWGSIAWKSVE
jgi:hypothetical protein